MPSKARKIVALTFLLTTLSLTSITIYTLYIYVGVYGAIRSLDVKIQEFDVKIYNETYTQIRNILTLQNPSEFTFRALGAEQRLFLNKTYIWTASASGFSPKLSTFVSPRSSLNITTTFEILSVEKILLITESAKSNWRMKINVFLEAPIIGSFRLKFTQTEMKSSPLARNFSEEQVVALVNGSRAYNYDLELEKIAFRHHAFRAAGSTGANETANWVKEQFENSGLEAWLEPFQSTNWSLLSKPSLMVDDDGNRSTTYDQVMIHSFQSTHYSWPTPEEGVFVDLIILPLPEAANRSEIGANPINMTEWNAINISGRVVLIGKEVRWSYDWEQTYKTKLSEQPPAAIVYTWWYDWMSFTPLMLSSAGGRPPSSLGPYYWDLGIPVGCVNYEEGLWIKNRENTKNVSAHFSIESVISTGTHFNVVGKIKGYKNPEKFIVISSHYDTVMCGGFSDNGGGTAGVIELAKVFADAVKKGFYRSSYTILFIAFAGEELGLVGSINYIKQHKIEMTNIVAVVNLDCIGNDDFYITRTERANGFDLDEIIFNAAQHLGITTMLKSPLAFVSDQESFRRPYWANDFYYWFWGLEAGISNATPIKSSALLISYPLLYSDQWSMGTPGWIHTSYDNSTSTETLNWIEVEDLENHIKVAALSIMRISPSVPDYPIILEAINNANEGDTIYMEDFS